MTYPFWVEFSLDSRYDAAGADDNIVNIGQNFGESCKVRLKFDMIVVENDPQDEPRMLIRPYWMLQGS